MRKPWFSAVAAALTLACHGCPATAASAEATHLARSSTGRAVGVNLGWVNGGHPDQIFADVAKHSRPWTMAGGDVLARLGSDGWPAASDVRLGFSEGAGQARTSGYKLRFRGSVTGYAGSSGVTITSSAFDGTWTTADVAVNDTNAWIEFRGARRSDGTAGLTDVSLMRPGHVRTLDHFNKQFASAVGPLAVIRAMQAGGPGYDLWGKGGAVGVMGNRDTTWSSRQRPRVGYAYDGPAWEEWVLLANLLDKDVWICVPYHVDAEYVRKLGYLLRYGSNGLTGEPYRAPTHDPTAWTVGTTDWYPGLEPGRRIYVEYVNELWNVGYGYPSSTEADSAWRAEVRAGDPHHLNWDGKASVDRWVAWKTVWISNLLREAWGTEMQRTVRVALPTQGDWGNWDRADTMLQYIDHVWGSASPWGTIDGMANPRQPVASYVATVAGSFYLHWSGRVAVTDANSAFQSLYGSLNGPTKERNTVKQRIDWGERRAARYGLTFSCYEGGTEIVDGLPPGWQSFWYSDARMTALLTEEMSYFFSKPHAEAWIHFMMLGDGTFGLSPDYGGVGGARWQALLGMAGG